MAHLEFCYIQQNLILSDKTLLCEIKLYCVYKVHVVLFQFTAMLHKHSMVIYSLALQAGAALTWEFLFQTYIADLSHYQSQLKCCLAKCQLTTVLYFLPPLCFQLIQFVYSKSSTILNCGTRSALFTTCPRIKKSVRHTWRMKYTIAE